LLFGVPVQTALGTNKLAGIAGTATATATFAAARAIRWPIVVTGAIAAFVGGLLGAHTVLRIDPGVLRIIVSVLLLVVSAVVAFRPRLGDADPSRAPHRSLWRSAAIGLTTGYYDGFFGPGAGVFMIFLYVAWLGLDFLAASGVVKATNFASNLGAIIVFAAAGTIDYRAGIVMAAGAIAGSFTGSRLALFAGAKFVRYVFLSVAWAVAIRLLLQALHR
ncbi:MAG: sulfite exporter TauE/SafE family protein, partial [Candidatus Eremiobacteraeota bacterium]|nr:sulfite exporter TauE/SafE family protein [Candidatus Eremiobacteraeota bacterium]